jgi:hypothetical protein
MQVNNLPARQIVPLKATIDKASEELDDAQENIFVVHSTFKTRQLASV